MKVTTTNYTTTEQPEPHPEAVAAIMQDLRKENPMKELPNIERKTVSGLVKSELVKTAIPRSHTAASLGVNPVGAIKVSAKKSVVIKKGVWDVSEDELLKKHTACEITIAERLGKRVNWTNVAENIPSRSAKQCRERWVNHLNPAVRKTPWTPEEDALLMELEKKYSNKWAKIARHMEGRTENMVKVRCKTLNRNAIKYNSGKAKKPNVGGAFQQQMKDSQLNAGKFAAAKKEEVERQASPYSSGITRKRSAELAGLAQNQYAMNNGNAAAAKRATMTQHDYVKLMMKSNRDNALQQQQQQAAAFNHALNQQVQQTNRAKLFYQANLNDAQKANVATARQTNAPSYTNADKRPSPVSTTSALDQTQQKIEQMKAALLQQQQQQLLLSQPQNHPLAVYLMQLAQLVSNATLASPQNSPQFQSSSPMANGFTQQAQQQTMTPKLEINTQNALAQHTVNAIQQAKQKLHQLNETQQQNLAALQPWLQQQQLLQQQMAFQQAQQQLNAARESTANPE